MRLVAREEPQMSEANYTMSAEAWEAHQIENVFIDGKGWIPRASVLCCECGDEGRIPTGWEDDGGPESGPHVSVTSFKYCECETGREAQKADATEDAAWEASYAQFLAATGQTREKHSEAEADWEARTERTCR